MPTDSELDFQLEIGHVLLIDIVGYSKLSINEQRGCGYAVKALLASGAQDTWNLRACACLSITLPAAS
jgi:hypothetical protein